MPTPHISAEPGDFAPLVLMPGDPRRARRIAETFFESPRLVTEVRSIEGWTGTIDGRPISVLASGMGMPSISIYATELFRFYGVQAIVRVGTAGGIADAAQLGEVVIASAAHTDSSMATNWIPGVYYSAAPDYDLLAGAVAAARAAGLPHRVGAIYSSDSFYGGPANVFPALSSYGTLAVEMEAAALYGVAAHEGRRALTVCTVTDHVLREEALSALERETGFANAAKVAIDALLSLSTPA
ncbi:MAG TPA: purine-nucleoside phosphorylase [Jatrophihabitans sp.]|jgi:purine-nucleoside phosphorylase